MKVEIAILVLLLMRITHIDCGLKELSHFACHDIVVNPQFEKDKARLIAHLKTVLKPLR